MCDAHKNFAYSTVATAPSPATSGTSLVVGAGDGGKFPAVPFNATIWPAGQFPLTTNAEIVRVTNISTDTLTITRTQESTSARTVIVGDQIAATITALSLTDIEGQRAGTGSAITGGAITVNTAGVSINVSDRAGTVTGATGGSITANSSGVSINIPSTTFSNSNNHTFGLNGSTITASYMPPYVSSYENLVLESNIAMTLNAASVSHAVGFFLPEPVSASFIRIPVVMTTNSTTLATTAQSMSASAALYSTWNAVIYSLGTGANSRSLQYVASGQNFWTFMNSISVAANGTQYSVSQFFSANAEGVGTTRTTQYSISNSNYSITTNQIATEWSGSRFIDINFASSLSAGAYWLVFGYSSSSGSNSTGFSNATNCNVRYSNHYGVSQANINFGVMGQTNMTSGGLLGAGSFSTVGGGTTNSIPLSAISSSASNVRPYFQMLRSA